jgi:hypothetical protein
MMCILVYASPVTLFAGSLDDLSSGSTTNQGGSTNSSSNQADTGSAISDYLKGYNPVTSENMATASTVASPIVNVLGTLSGFIIMVVSAGIFVVTALDLAYIGLPFTRSLLNPQLNAQSGAPMGGMGMGGMGMGGMSATGAPPERGLRRRWVSDEAVACVNLANTQNNQGSAMSSAAGMGMGMGMGMGGGMGMPGGMGMGGGMGQPAPTQPTKSIILEYLKKRMFFIIIFAVASIILMSSILTDCGINIASLITKIFTKFNGQIANVNI